MGNPLRHQLASTAPVTLSALLRAIHAQARGPAAVHTELEALLRSEFSVAGVRLCASGTESLVLALRCAESLLGSPPAVAYPAYSCFDLASAAVRFARPIHFYDVDPSTLGPDSSSLETALRAGARIVVTASLFGIPIDWSAIDAPIREAGALVIEDAAQGHGARWKGSRLGAHGRLGVLSFARGKGWTGGTGGAVLVRDARDETMLATAVPEPTSAALGLGAFARAAAHWSLGRPSLYGLPRSLPGLGLGETRYHEVAEPRAMPGSAAALILSTAAAAEQEARRRQQAARDYDRLLVGSAGLGMVSIPSGCVAGYLRYPLAPAAGMRAFRSPERAARLGAAASYPRPLPRLEQLARLHADRAAATTPWPGAEALAARLVTLPTHGLMREEEREALVDMLLG